MENDEIIATLRAGGDERDAVEVAELLGTLLGTLSHGRIVMYFKRAFPEIPLQTLHLSGLWTGVGGEDLDDAGFNDLLRPWLKGKPK